MSKTLGDSRMGSFLCAAAVASALLGAACNKRGDAQKGLGTAPKDGRSLAANLLVDTPKPRFTVNAGLGGKVVYLGMDADENPVQPGGTVEITHYWQVVAPPGYEPGPGWRLFVHAIAPGAGASQNLDHVPVWNQYPVSEWKSGDIIRDTHTLRLLPNWPSDEVEILVGLWNDQGRMPIYSGPKTGDGRVRAGRLKVHRPQAKVARYNVKRAVPSAPQIDGDLSDPAWAHAPETTTFVNTMTGAPVGFHTTAKMLWDDAFFYVAFKVTDDDIWSSLTSRDDHLWEQEAVELMIDADGNGGTYLEFQVAPTGALMDTYLPAYRKYEDTVVAGAQPFSWNAQAKVGVKVSGTLNMRDDVDDSWSVELAIPMKDINGMDKGGARVPPLPGDIWRLNMFRLDAPKGGRQRASAWSPPLVGDFHALKRFGEVVFVGAAPSTPASSSTP